MQIEIIKPYKKLVVGQKLIIDSGYSQKLIDKGFAKSLELVEKKELKEKNDIGNNYQPIVDRTTTPPTKAPKAAKK